MEGKTVKDSSIISSHLMLIQDAGNFLVNETGMFRPMVHGGTLMTLVDEIAGMVATKHARTQVATACMDMQFLSPAFAGNRLIVKASVNYTTKTSMEIGIRIEAEDMKTGISTHTNSCYLIAVAIDNEGKPKQVPTIIPETDEEKRRFKEAKIRNDERLQKRKNKPID